VKHKAESQEQDDSTLELMGGIAEIDSIIQRSNMMDSMSGKNQSVDSISGRNQSVDSISGRNQSGPRNPQLHRLRESTSKESLVQLLANATAPSSPVASTRVSTPSDDLLASRRAESRASADLGEDDDMASVATGGRESRIDREGEELGDEEGVQRGGQHSRVGGERRHGDAQQAGEGEEARGGAELHQHESTGSRAAAESTSKASTPVTRIPSVPADPRATARSGSPNAEPPATTPFSPSSPSDASQLASNLTQLASTLKQPQSGQRLNGSAAASPMSGTLALVPPSGDSQVAAIQPLPSVVFMSKSVAMGLSSNTRNGLESLTPYLELNGPKVLRRVYEHAKDHARRVTNLERIVAQVIERVAELAKSLAFLRENQLSMKANHAEMISDITMKHKKEQQNMLELIHDIQVRHANLLQRFTSFSSISATKISALEEGLEKKADNVTVMDKVNRTDFLKQVQKLQQADDYMAGRAVGRDEYKTQLMVSFFEGYKVLLFESSKFATS
jgi:hypothetical protein